MSLISRLETLERLLSRRRAEVVVDPAYAHDLAGFARALGFEPDGWQARVLQSRSKRLLLNCSRQSGKSTTAALLATHTALYAPGSLTLLVSPSLRQSSELFRKVSEWFGRLKAAPALIEDNRLSCTLRNRARIVSLPSSESTVRGFSGADLIIEDESARVSDDLYRAVRPTLATSGGRLVLMGTPFGKRGHFFNEWTEGGDSWERIEVKASECPRIAAVFLAEELRALGPMWFAQEYQCEFLEAVNALFGFDLVMSAVSDQYLPLFAEGA